MCLYEKSCFRPLYFKPQYVKNKRKMLLFNKNVHFSSLYLNVSGRMYDVKKFFSFYKDMCFSNCAYLDIHIVS